MATETAVGASQIAAHTRAILRVALVAVLWGVFLCWCLLVMRGEALDEATRAAIWLGRVIAVYLGMLSYWILYNKLLHALRALPVLARGEERAFDRDYFGRPVAVAAGVAFADQHLVLDYADSQKLYRAPSAEEADRDEQAVGADLKKLAAAAAVGSFDASPAGTATPPAPADPAAPKRKPKAKAKRKPKGKGKSKAKSNPEDHVRGL